MLLQDRKLLLHSLGGEGKSEEIKKSCPPLKEIKQARGNLKRQESAVDLLKNR